jgi:uncharacterized protein YceH (UPF0502 family)
MSELRLNGGNGVAVQPLRGKVAETKHDRFLRLAPGRVQRALDALRLVAQLSSTENEYSESEAEQIVIALSRQVADIERKLARKKEQKTTFEFE